MIFIMRHGQTDKNQAKLLQGRSNVPLNAVCEEEAKAVGAWFKEQGIEFARVYSSPLIRAMQTAMFASGFEKEEILTEYIHKIFCERGGMDLKLDLVYTEPKESKAHRNAALMIQNEASVIARKAKLFKALYTKY